MVDEKTAYNFKGLFLPHLVHVFCIPGERSSANYGDR